MEGAEVFNFEEQPYLLIDGVVNKLTDETNEIDKFAGSLYESSQKFTTSGENTNSHNNRDTANFD